MDLRQFDPPVPLDYLLAVTLITRSFPEVTSHMDLVEDLGFARVTDVSHLPFFRQMDASDPLPGDYSRRCFQFRDGAGRRGILEVVFLQSQLVNIRIQLFFKGWFAKAKARRFLAEQVIPSLEVMFGPADEVTQHHTVFQYFDMVILARYVPGTPSISTYLMHEDHAF